MKKLDHFNFFENSTKIKVVITDGERAEFYPETIHYCLLTKGLKKEGEWLEFLKAKKHSLPSFKEAFAKWLEDKEYQKTETYRDDFLEQELEAIEKYSDFLDVVLENRRLSDGEEKIEGARFRAEISRPKIKTKQATVSDFIAQRIERLLKFDASQIEKDGSLLSVSELKQLSGIKNVTLRNSAEGIEIVNIDFYSEFDIMKKVKDLLGLDKLGDVPTEIKQEYHMHLLKCEKCNREMSVCSFCGKRNKAFKTKSIPV